MSRYRIQDSILKDLSVQYMSVGADINYFGDSPFDKHSFLTQADLFNINAILGLPKDDGLAYFLESQKKEFAKTGRKF